MNAIDILWAVLLIVLIAIILAIALALAGKFLAVKEDKRAEEVMKNMPNANCGACGFPGCAGLVGAILDGDEKHIKKCAVIKDDKAQIIKDYLNSTPDENGNVLKVDL